MNKQHLVSGIGIKSLIFSIAPFFPLFLLILSIVSDLSSANDQSSIPAPETKRNLPILVLYTLDVPKPTSENESEGNADATSSASPRGPNPKYVAEIVAWELREEGKINVKAFYEINDINEIFHYPVIIIGSISKGGEISDTTKLIFQTLQEMSPAERRKNFSKKVVSCFVTSDSYDGCEQGLSTMHENLENYQVWIAPGLIITEDMEFDDAAEKIRFYTSKLKEVIHEKTTLLE